MGAPGYVVDFGRFWNFVPVTCHHLVISLQTWPVNLFRRDRTMGLLWGALWGVLESLNCWGHSPGDTLRCPAAWVPARLL